MAKKDLIGTICPGIAPESERSISYFILSEKTGEADRSIALHSKCEVRASVPGVGAVDAPRKPSCPPESDIDWRFTGPRPGWVKD